MTDVILFEMTFENEEVIITASAVQGKLFETVYSGKVLHIFYTGLWTGPIYRGLVVEE